MCHLDVAIFGAGTLKTKRGDRSALRGIRPVLVLKWRMHMYVTISLPFSQAHPYSERKVADGDRFWGLLPESHDLRP